MMPLGRYWFLSLLPDSCFFPRWLCPRGAEAYAVRLVQGLMGAVAAWAVLAIGGGLYAVAMMLAASALFMT